MKTKYKIIALVFLLAIIFPGLLKAQEIENEFQTRTELDLVHKPLKKLKLNFTPEVRFDEDFSIDGYIFEAGAEYKLLKFLELGATYRFEVNPRKTKETEYFNRFAFSATLKEEFGDFEPAFRLRYSNYADDDITDQDFLRYKMSVKYDIPKCKLTPFVAAEAFQSLNEGSLHKMRYSTGADYKLFKNNYLGASYKLDYYKNEYKNRHIFSIGYKIKF